MNNEFKHEIIITAAYDRKEEGYGVHGCDLQFTVSKDGKGITVQIYTGWYLNGPQGKVLPAFVQYHDTVPHYEGQECREKCDVTGGICYSDGSGLLADEFFECLKREGSKGVFKKMEQQYVEWIKGGKE